LVDLPPSTKNALNDIFSEMGMVCTKINSEGYLVFESTQECFFGDRTQIAKDIMICISDIIPPEELLAFKLLTKGITLIA
jgi:hypothetical protein